MKMPESAFAALTAVGCVGFLVAAILFVVMLAGCATPPAPQTEIVSRAAAPEPIRVPVLLPCLTKEQIPAPPPTWMRADRSGEYNELAARIDFRELEFYIVQSQSRMWGCVKSFEDEKKP
jgi:hypothetical protein